MGEEGPVNHEISNSEQCGDLPKQVPGETSAEFRMEAARWWREQLGLADEEWKCMSADHPELASTPAVGFYEDDIHCMIFFLAQFEGDFLPTLIDCWLHEYIELEFFAEVSDHEAFGKAVAGIAEYVSAF